MAAPAAKKKLVVLGGTGFLGSRITKHASLRSWHTVSISRTGPPSFPPNHPPPPWSDDVTYAKANIFAPETYRHHLADADAVVHSMGILLEADYKGVLQGRENPLTGLRRAFGARESGNPLAEEGRGTQGEEGGLTYERMNRDSALLLAREAAAAKVPTMVYISAAAGFPLLPARYISSKREAEARIAAEYPNIRGVFFRPGFLYDSSRAFTVPMAALTQVAAGVNSLTGGRLTWLMGAGGTRPSRVEDVGQAVVEAIEDEGVRGVVEVERIEELAQKAWRRGML